MGQAFKSMQNQRGFEYRKLDAIKIENLAKSFSKKYISNCGDERPISAIGDLDGPISVHYQRIVLKNHDWVMDHNLWLIHGSRFSKFRGIN